MTPEEIQKLLDKVKEQNKEQFAAFEASIKELTAGNLDKDAAEKMFAEHFEKMGLTEEGAFKEVHDALKNLSTEVQNLKIQKAAEATPFEQLKNQLNENKDALKAISEGNREKFVKIKIDLSADKANATRSSITSDYRGYQLADFGQVATRALVMYEAANVMPIDMTDSGGNVRYTDWDKDTISRAAAARAEGTAYPESTATWIGYSKPVQKIADSIPITKELLRDVKGVQGEIENFIRTNLLLQRDSDIYSGTGVAPAMTGWYTAATAWVPGSYSGPQTPNANIFDLIAVLRSDIMDNRQAKYMVNKVLLNPNDILRMDFSKDDNGRYNLPPFISADGSVVKGVEVLESSIVTSNTLLIGDFTYARYYDAQTVELEFGYIGNQFRDDLITLKGSTFGLALIREADNDGFLKVTDITAAIAAINDAGA